MVFVDLLNALMTEQASLAGPKMDHFAKNIVQQEWGLPIKIFNKLIGVAVGVEAYSI